MLGFFDRLLRCGALVLLGHSALASAQRPTYIAVIGDGAAAALEGSPKPWPSRFHPFQQLSIPIVTNLASPRLGVAEASLALAQHNTKETVDYVVIQFGVDDALPVEAVEGEGEHAPRISAAIYESQLRALVDSIRERDEQTGIILLTPTPLVNGGSNEVYAEAVRAIAAEKQMGLIDLHRIFARRDRFAGHAATDWLVDGLYPSDIGHTAIQHLVARAIQCPDPFLPGAAHTARAAWFDPERWHGRPDFSIPVLDVSGQNHRQAIVDREPGQYLGHPTTVLLEDGRTLIAVYPKGHGKGAIVMKRSIDGGATWSERLETPASWATSKEVPTIHRVLDAGGTKRLILFSGLYPIRMSASEDDGLHWSELAPIGDFGGIVAMGTVIETKTPDRYLALFHDDGRFLAATPTASKVPHWTQFHVYQTESLDGGLTWGAPRAITHSSWHHCEPGSIRSPDGAFLTTTYGHWTKGEAPYIVSVRLGLDELDELAKNPRELR